MRSLQYRLLIAVFFSSQICNAQLKDYKPLLEAAFRYSGLFVDVKPIENIKLDHNDLQTYFSNLKEDFNISLDTIMLRQIIDNSKRPDTTLWTDNELPNFILVKSRSEDIDFQYVKNKFGLKDKKSVRQYRKKINGINQTCPFDKNVYSFSRPVIDSSGLFAIVQYQNAHSGLNGGGGITLYKRVGISWSEVGAITRWVY